MSFSIGDKVVKAYGGKKPLTVCKISPAGSRSYVYAKYDHSGQSVHGYDSEFKPYEGNTENMTKDALYKIQTSDGREAYGVHIGTDSQGRYIMEEKGSGSLHVVTKDMIEEVLPFTFSVRMNGREQHFQGEAGKVKKGEILLYTAGGVDNFAFAVVKNVDTKNKGAKVWEGVRVITEAL